MALSLVSAIGTAVVFWLGGHMVLSGEFTIGTIVAFGAYLTQLYGPLSSLTNTSESILRPLSSASRECSRYSICRSISTSGRTRRNRRISEAGCVSKTCRSATGRKRARTEQPRLDCATWSALAGAAGAATLVSPRARLGRLDDRSALEKDREEEPDRPRWALQGGQLRGRTWAVGPLSSVPAAPERPPRPTYYPGCTTRRGDGF